MFDWLETLNTEPRHAKQYAREIMSHVRGTYGEAQESTISELKEIGLFDLLADDNGNVRYSDAKLIEAISMAREEGTLMNRLVSGDIEGVRKFIAGMEVLQNEAYARKQKSYDDLDVRNGRSVTEWKQLVNEGKAQPVMVYVKHIDNFVEDYRLVDSKPEPLFTHETEEELANRGL